MVAVPTICGSRLRRTAQRQRWKIDRDAMQLGFFSFNKLLMFKDLARRCMAGRSAGGPCADARPAVRRLRAGGAYVRGQQTLDHVLPPDKLFHVVDADASQAKVIEEVRSGRNLVVQGPPGTGKSQTITNIIAAAAKEGKPRALPG